MGLGLMVDGLVCSPANRSEVYTMLSHSLSMILFLEIKFVERMNKVLIYFMSVEPTNNDYHDFRSHLFRRQFCRIDQHARRSVQRDGRQKADLYFWLCVGPLWFFHLSAMPRF